MSPTTKAQWQLHFCVLLWGFTAILGKLITMPALALVWWRMLIVALCLACVPRVWRELRRMPLKLLAIYVGIGALVSLHWLTFYGAIKLANASVAVTCLALAPAFLSLVEPWVAQRRFELRELLLGLAVIPGVALVVGGVPAGMHAGVAVGCSSALLVSFFIALNKRYAGHSDSLVVTALELGTGALLLPLLAPFFAGGLKGLLQPPQGMDAVWMLVLALGCTLLPFTLSLVALRQLSAFSAQLVVNLEPVYTIVLAALLLGEQRELGPAFYAGVAVVLSAVFLHPLLAKRAELIAPDALAADAEKASP
ncbi:MAG: family transporter [Hydrocarboniphaga sp.]|uniref:EamA family transporter n=1 Tax=Hydrocarboniphaga sp. TaxID=2033016 RepID=UPI002635CF35|nr:DMT family transporter [Hydrocarboniphaga sp.]MDB5968547.1 family transporter [Hydrocarboniphaga sp.]